MVSGIIKLATAGILAGGLFALLQSPTQAGNLEATYAAVGGSTLVPYGWVDFCDRYGHECDTSPMPAMDVNLTPKSLKLIRKINEWVNKTIKPMSDQQHWNKIDQWDYPTDGYGDCEDYALLKRRLLIEEGFPRQGLLMTVVKDEHNEGHAVLTIKTNHGEFVLDNLHDEIAPWSRTGYRFVKRQSQTDPNEWVSLGEPTQGPLVVSR